MVVRRETLDDLLRLDLTALRATESGPIGAHPYHGAVSDDLSEAAVAVRVGLLGCGNVGAALVELIGAQGATIDAPAPACASRSPGSPCATSTKPRPVTLPDGVLTNDAAAVVDDPDIDLVVEVIGGVEPARELDPRRPQGGQARGHRQQGAARQRTAPSCSQPPRPPASTCSSRRRWPAASRSSARCASRWWASASAG